MLPLVGLAGNEADLAAAAAEGDRVLGGDALLREVPAPGVDQAGIQHGYIDAGAIIGDLAVVEAEVGHVDRVQVPGAQAVGEVRSGDRVYRRTLALGVGVGGGHVGQRPDGGQILFLGLQGHGLDLVDHIADAPVAAQIGQQVGGHVGVEQHVDADRPPGGDRRQRRRSQQHHQQYGNRNGSFHHESSLGMISPNRNRLHRYAAARPVAGAAQFAPVSHPL